MSIRHERLIANISSSIMNEVIMLSNEIIESKRKLLLLDKASIYLEEFNSIINLVQNRKEDIRFEISKNTEDIKKYMSIIFKGKLFGVICIDRNKEGDIIDKYILRNSITDSPIHYLSEEDLNRGFVSMTRIKIDPYNENKVTIWNVLFDIKSGTFITATIGRVKDKTS